MTMRLVSGRVIVLLLGAAIFLVPPASRAQEGPTPSSAGPTREAGANTAQGYLEQQRELTPRLLLRYRAFQRDFVNDFGVLPPTMGDRVDGLIGLKARLDARWGDAAIYQWIERGFTLYAWIQASTRMEKRGFDLRVETDEMAGGKFGVQMTRPLGTGSVE